MTAVEHIYRYSSESSLDELNDGLRLHLASDQTEVLSSGFFEGKLLEPGITARCLRTVSDLVGTRFYIPPSMLERILREADPVVTVTRDVIRFEGFSSCCSTYVRHDLTDECYEAVNIRPGTTNVDFGADMRATLARITGGTPLQLAIQRDAVLIGKFLSVKFLCLFVGLKALPKCKLI